MTRLSVYDFDRTIYAKDTGVEILKKLPVHILILFSPKMIQWFLIDKLCGRQDDNLPSDSVGESTGYPLATVTGLAGGFTQTLSEPKLHQ